jgi:4-amino-4-deoxy-L-arabinose transferase-like glycosyltransferase
MCIEASRRHHLIVVIVCAAVFRTGFLLWDWSGRYVVPKTTTSREYFRHGYGICAGYGYVRPIGGPASKHLAALQNRVERERIRVTPDLAGPLPQEGAFPETLRPPGMSILVAGANYLFGTRADVPIQFLGMGLDTLAAGLVWWIAGTCFGPRVGLVAGLLYGFFPPFARGSINLEPDGLLSPFVALNLACALAACRTQGRRRLGLWIAGGLALGLGSYLRPDYLMMPVFMFLGIWAYTRDPVRSAFGSLGMLAVTLLALSPWAYRNHRLTGRWIFSSTSVGATLITGLGEYHNPWGFGYLDEDRAAQAAGWGLPSPWTSEADLRFRELFWKSVAQNPAAYAKAVIRRLPMALAPPYAWGFANPWKAHTFSELRAEGKDRYQIAKGKPLYVVAAYGDCLATAGISLLSLGCVVFMLLKESRRAGPAVLLICPHVYSILSHVLTHLEPRFLLPSMFCWLIGTGYVLGAGWRAGDACLPPCSRDEALNSC